MDRVIFMKNHTLRIVLVILALLSGAGAGWAAQTNRSGADQADRNLNAAYQKVIRLLKAYPETKAKLVQSQLAWIKYRDLDASFTATLPGAPKAPASDKRQQALGTLTVERTGFLGRMFVNLPEAIKETARPPWPARIRTVDFTEFQLVAIEKLPPGVMTPEQAGYGSSKELCILEIDLNKDGTPEIIACYRGGNGGDISIVYQKKRGKYEQIGEFFGFGLDLLAMKNGYYQIGAGSKSGGGDYENRLYQYDKGQYREARTDHFHQERGYKGTTYPQSSR